MKRIDTLIGYQIYPARKNESNYADLKDVQHCSVRVREMRSVDPVDAITNAAKYKDKSLEIAQNRVLRIGELYRLKLSRDKYWFDTTWYNYELDFEFQGDINERRWYACHLNRVCPNDFNADLLKKILKHSQSGRLESLEELIHCLKQIKAFEIIYDKDGNMYYRTVTDTNLDMVQVNPKPRQSEQEQEQPMQN